MNNKSPQQQLLDKFGVLHQADIWVEELSELIQAIQKAKRYKVLTEDGIMRTKGLFGKKSRIAKNLYEEFADVKNVLKQFECIADPYDTRNADSNTNNKIFNILEQ